MNFGLTRDVSAITPNFELLSRLGYVRLEETLYSSDHPSVRSWTARFAEETRSHGIFERFEEEVNEHSVEIRARVVSTQWHRFSCFMPWFLCQAAALMPNNTLRHYVIQTAFEELGMRKSDEIHPDLFWKTAKLLGIQDSDGESFANEPLTANALEFLKLELLGAPSHQFILGLMLGLEIPAQENIETVFKSLAPDEARTQRLSETLFFQLHRQIEIEHVRMNVANFLRFCPDEDGKGHFHLGFRKGLEFWQMFWGVLSQIITRESGVLDRSQKNA